MTTEQALELATIKLNSEIKNPHLDAEILLSHILKKPREFILAHPEKKLTNTQITNYKLQISRRAKGEPAAYITGHKEFYGLDFFVDKNVLIPRPETEMMVDEALRITDNAKHITFIDVGAGSGCIIISLLKQIINSKLQITNYHRFSGIPPAINIIKRRDKFLAADISKSALVIARKNAKLHNVHKKIKFLQGDLLEPIIKKTKSLEIRNYNLVILANLPYLTPTQIKNSASIKYEPKLALDAGKDGLKYYRRLFKQIKQLAKFAPNSRIFAMIEIDPSQTKKIKLIIEKELFNAKIQIKKDLRGLNRLVICSMGLRQD